MLSSSFAIAGLSSPDWAPDQAFAQGVGGQTVQLPDITVSAMALKPAYVVTPPTNAYAAEGSTRTERASLGPLGDRSIKDTPYSITTVPQDVIVNEQLRNANDALRYLPSVRDEQGLDFSRPQSRGFFSSVANNSRLDGLNIISTTANPAENLQSVQVLNGVAGALYGPSTPAGVFDEILKRPTDYPLFRYIQSFDTNRVFTEQIDAGGRTGPDNRVGYRINIVHGQGEAYVKDSYLNRTLGSLALDYQVDNNTLVSGYYGHYAFDEVGLPGAIVYNGGKSTFLPQPVDPTQSGLGQPGAGFNLRSDTGLIKAKHDFNSDWHLEIGGLYENAVRNLFNISNTLQDNSGNYTVIKNSNAAPRFTIGSNSAALNGRADIFGFRNDLTLATNGFVQRNFNYFNSITTTLGTANLAAPIVFPPKPVPANGGQYQSAVLTQQSIITGDTLHFNNQLAIQGVLSTSFLNAQNFNARSVATSQTSANGVLSPTVSLIYTPTSRFTAYFTYADSVEQGDLAPAGVPNANQILAPFRDSQYEIGAKYALLDNLLITLDGFRMTRPLAFPDLTTNVFQVEGTQRNYGVELFVQGSATRELSLLGGLTYLDPRLQGATNPTINGKLVVGVPHYRVNMLADYHPTILHGAALTAAVHYEGSRAATITNNSFAGSFATFDLGARYSRAFDTHRATFRLQVLNVADVHYYVDPIAAGNIVASAGSNTAYLGAPRTLQASLELDF